MKKAFIREEARCYFIPFLLGDNSTSHHLSKRIFRKYGIISLILDTKGSFADIWDFSCKFIKLSPSDNQSLTLLQLIDISREFPTAMPILIPCSKEYETFTQLFEKELESVFALSSKELLFETSPLKIIPS